MLGERALVDGVAAARSVTEIDLQPLRRDPCQRVGDNVLVRKKGLRQLIEVGVVLKAAVLDRGDQPGRDSIPPLARAQHQCDERAGQLSGPVDPAEQLDCLDMAGARPPATRRSQQLSTKLFGVLNHRQLLKPRISVPEHVSQRRITAGRLQRRAST